MPRKRKDGYLEKIMEMKKRRSEDVENEDVGGGSGGVDGGGGDAGGWSPACLGFNKIDLVWKTSYILHGKLA